MGSSLAVYRAPPWIYKDRSPRTALIQHRARRQNEEIPVYLWSGERREASNKPSLEVKVGGRSKGSLG